MWEIYILISIQNAYHLVRIIYRSSLFYRLLIYKIKCEPLAFDESYTTNYEPSGRNALACFLRRTRGARRVVSVHQRFHYSRDLSTIFWVDHLREVTAKRATR